MGKPSLLDGNAVRQPHWAKLQNLMYITIVIKKVVTLRVDLSQALGWWVPPHRRSGAGRGAS